MQRLESNQEYLKKLKRSRGKKRQELIKAMTVKDLKLISEIAHNILKRNLEVDEKTLKRLKRHAESVRLLGKKSPSFKKKKQVLLQSGSGLLTALLIPAISALVGAIVKRT